MVDRELKKYICVMSDTRNKRLVSARVVVHDYSLITNLSKILIFVNLSQYYSKLVISGKFCK